jgi:hypothetical protein
LPRQILLIAAVASLLALPAGAGAQSSPFAPLPQPQQQQPTTTTGSTTSTDSSGGGLKSWQEILIFMGGIVLIGGIGYGIVLDARRSAPLKEGEEGHIGEPTKPLPKARTKPVRRAKARQARAARKRNR